MLVLLLSAYVLFWPNPAGGGSGFPGADKVVHAVLFALLAATTRLRFGSAARLLVAVAAYGVASEVVQGLSLETRSGDPFDVLADVVGAGLGWLAAGRYRSRNVR